MSTPSAKPQTSRAQTARAQETKARRANSGSQLPRRWDQAVRRTGFAKLIAMARAMSGSQWLLRGVIVLGVALAAGVTLRQPGQPIGPLVVVAVLIGLVLAIVPQAIIAPIFHILIMFAWLALPTPTINPSVVLAAAGLALVQLGMAAAAVGPPSLAVPARVLRPFLITAVVLTAAAAVLTVGLWLAQRAHLPGQLGLMIMALLGIGAFAVLVTARAGGRSAE